MDVGSIARLATGMAQERTEQAVGIAVLKKTLDLQASTAAALLDALPPVQALPAAGPGGNVDTTA